MLPLKIALAFVLLISSASAAEVTSAQLRKIAERIRSSNEGAVCRDAGDDSSWINPKQLTREASLQVIYRDLAALEYKESLVGVAGDQASQAKSALSRLEKDRATALKDAELVTVTPDMLIPASCTGQCCYEQSTYLGSRCVCCMGRSVSVAAGRKVSTKSDLEIAKLDKTLDEVARRLGGEPDQAVSLHYQSAQIYEEMANAAAQAAETPAPQKAVKEKREPEPIPANETKKQRKAREQRERERQVEDSAEDSHKSLERET